jgi:signal transduction histidine kinase
LGDWTVIRKITDNLLSNAVKYTKEGSVSLKVGWKKSLVIEVCDTGIGIEKEYLKKVFKPFERGVQDIYRETSGSGLGLAIVKELTDAMGGKITCESEVGKGSVFKVVLPQSVHTDSKAQSTHEDNSAK